MINGSQIELFRIPVGEDRLKAPASLFKGARGNTSTLGYTEIGTIFQSITDPNNTKLTSLTDRLEQAILTSGNAYKAIKEKECPALIPGRFPVRKNGDCLLYVPLLGFDIDHIGDGQTISSFKDMDFLLETTLSQLRKSPYVFAAFPSPSRAGMRVFIWCDSNPDTHKVYHQAGCDYLSKICEIPTDKALQQQWKQKGLDNKSILKKLKQTEHIDTSTNNLARLWFYTHVPKDLFFLNVDSQVFFLKEMSPNPAATQKTQPTASNTAIPLSESAVIEVCRQKTDRQNLPTGRNNYVFAFACELCKHGISESAALRECLRLAEPDFGENEIEKSVRSAYQSKSRIYTDQQIQKYLRMTSREEVRRSNSLKEKRAKTAKKSDSQEASKSRVNRPKFMLIIDLLQSRYDFRRNVIANEIEISLKGKNDFKELNENDLICELLEAGFNGVETPLISFLRSSKYIKKYDAFKEFFSQLPEWKEGDPDYITQLANFVDAKDQHWFNSQFKKMIVRTVACAIGKIAFNKQCFVLMSNQNDGKTTFLRFLCPPALQNFITDQIDIYNKDGRLTLCQNLLINLDELSQFSKQDIKKVKGLFTTDKVKERLPYDKKASNHRRRASFLASTNEDEFLIDETGNVRWLVFEINGVKHDNGGPNGYNQQIDMDLVYSQAYALLKSGFEFQLTKAELAKSERNNKSFQMTTIEQELIQERFAPAPENGEGAVFMTATDILQEIEIDTKTNINLRNIGRSLKLLGFKKSQKYFPEYSYQKKGYWVRSIKSDNE